MIDVSLEGIYVVTLEIEERQGLISKLRKLLLDSQVPSPPQLSAGDFFFALDGRFDRVDVWP